MNGQRVGRRWRIGVVGCGEWGPNHVRNFVSLPNAEVVGVADGRADRLARMQVLALGVAGFPDLDTMLEAAAPEAVVIATPTRTHYDVARAAILAGRHVLCEKPLCESPEHADELVQLADRRGVRLMVGHVFLFNPGILKLKALVSAGELGRLYYLSARRTNLGPIRNDVNAVLDLASHDVSIFNFLLDEVPVEVSAVGRSFLQPEIEDVSFITLQYLERGAGHRARQLAGSEKGP